MKKLFDGFTRRTLVVTILVTVVTLIIAITVWHLLFGKLLVYSPLKPGFTRHELKTVTVYVEHDAGFNGFESLDTLTSTVERAHKMVFTEKPCIYIFSDSLSYRQRTVTKARFYAYPNGALAVSPWALREAAEGIISLNIYLRHELSHIILDQHMGFFNAYFRFPNWLLEGIAVYTTNQMGTSWYPSKAETLQLIKLGNFVPPELFKTKEEDKIKLNVKYRSAFIYSEFACIVDYLIAAYGSEKFYNYLTGLCAGSNHELVFSDVYGISFNSFLAQFKTHVK